MATSGVPVFPASARPRRTRVQSPGMIVTGVPFTSHDAKV